MLVEAQAFIGELPKTNPRYLPPAAAQIAADARIEGGTIGPIAAPIVVTDMGVPRKTVYLDGTTWLAWTDHVSILPGPTATERLYITGDGNPKLYVNDTYYPLALYRPQTKPNVAHIAAPDGASSTTFDVAYALTYVTGFGEESHPSPLSNLINVEEDSVVRLSAIPDAPQPDRNITHVRIYVSRTSQLGATELYYVDEIAHGTTTYDHDPALTGLGEAILTSLFDPPPADLRGIIAMPNGMMVGHTDREILFCEPYQPHAWPSAYRRIVDYDIIGLAAFGSQIAVMTAGTPYRGQGSHPDSFYLEKTEENLPCVSARGIVDMGYAAAYPSTDGLVVIGSAGAQIVTRNIFSRSQWAKLDPASIRAARHGTSYFFGFDGTLPNGPGRSAMIDLTGETAFLVRSTANVAALYHDIRTGRLYYQDAATGMLNVFDAADASSFSQLTWRSKLIDTPYDAAFAAIEIEGDTAGMTAFRASIFADGRHVHTIGAINTPQRLPQVCAGQWEVEIVTDATITSVAMAESLEELGAKRL